MRPERCTVVKVGGSLAPCIETLVPVLKDSPRPLLIVPGGGAFADAIRSSACADNADAAHWMACAAMDQYGWTLAAQGLPTTVQVTFPVKTAVLLPYCVLRQNDPLPHSWDVTSDTIAAWAAKMCGCDLLLLKSVDGIETGGKIPARIDHPVPTETVDPCFIPFVLKNQIRTFVINGNNPGRVRSWLRGEPVRGTGIGTTF